jgi:hypothetical protein
MRRSSATWIGLFVALASLVPASAGGPGSVEVLFTPAVIQDAVALKDGLRIGRLESSSALSLVGATPEKKKAYGDKLAGVTAVVILGEDALKAVADVEFPTSVIVVNATGHASCKGRIVRVFDGAGAPADAQAVTSASAVKGLLATDKEVSLKGPITTVVQGVLDALR